MASIFSGTQISNDFTKKGAAPGGDYREPFERSMAQLGWTYVKEKAPRLLDHVMGFQLVERDQDENERAIGVFAFKVGRLWLYVPIIYDNGQVEGHDMLWIKNTNNIVPLAEKWVNYLISKQPRSLGEPERRTRSELHLSAPNLLRLAYPTLTKFAADGSRQSVPVLAPPELADWAKPAVGFVQHVIKAVMKSASLEALLRESPGATKYAMEVCTHFPRFRYLMDKAAGGNAVTMFERVVDAWSKQAGDDSQQTATIDIFTESSPGPAPETMRASQKRDKEEGLLPDWPSPEKKARLTATTDRDVRLYQYEDMTSADAMATQFWTDGERKELIEKGYVVRDGRDGARRVIVTGPTSLTTPTQTGIYQVLNADGDFTRCLVVVGGRTDSGTSSLATVWPLTGDEAPIVTSPEKVLTAGDEGRQALLKWIDQLPAASGLDTDQFEAVFFSSTGEATQLFCNWSEINRGKAYRGHFVCQKEEGEPVKANLPGKNLQSRLHFDGHNRPAYAPSVNLRIRSNDGTGTRLLENFSGCVYVPASGKVLRRATMEANRETNRFLPGTLKDRERKLTEKTASFKIWSDGDINIQTHDWTRRLTTPRAHYWLVKGAGLSVTAAREILQQIEGRHGKAARYTLKQADFGSSSTADRGYGGPSLPDPYLFTDGEAAGGSMVMPQQEYYVRQPEIGAANTDRSIYDPMKPPRNELTSLMDRAQTTGDHDLLDVASVASVVQGMNREDLVGTELPIIMKALDAIGKLRIKFYYRPKAFEDRYGDRDMPELKAILKTTFSDLGDLAIFLKEKTVDPFGVDMREPSLDDAANN